MIIQLLRFFKGLVTHVRVDDEVRAQPAGELREQLPYHWRIVAIGASCGVICLVAAVALYWHSNFGDDDFGPGREELKLLWPVMLPLIFAASGILWGVALACLFAPRSFLLSPAGAKWMRLIGAKTSFQARFVAAIFTVFATAFFGAMIVGALYNRCPPFKAWCDRLVS